MIWQHEKKAMNRLSAIEVPLLTVHIVRNEYIFFSIRYDTRLISPSLSITWQLLFNKLCLNCCFGKKGQPVSSLFHIPTGFSHSSGHAGLRGSSTDGETVYWNCLPLCTMGRKTWWHRDPHVQNYAVCGDGLAKINMIYHFYAPG